MIGIPQALIVTALPTLLRVLSPMGLRRLNLREIARARLARAPDTRGPVDPIEM